MIRIKLPKPYDWRWMIGWLALTGILGALLVGARLFVLGKPFSFASLPGFFLLSFAAAFSICIFGFFGAYLLMLATSAGIAAGLIGMIGYYIRGGGWEDLAGPVVFIEFALIGLLAGIGAEFIRYLMKGPRGKDR